MSDIKWIKLATDMFDNRKIRYLRKLPDGDGIVLIWIMILTLAGKCNDDGRIWLVENIPYTPQMLAHELDFDISTVTLALGALEQLGMIHIMDDLISVTGWAEHQNIDGMEKVREQNRLRKAKQRERELTESRDSHVTVTQCHATDRERDKEKESLSYILARACACEESKQKLLGGSIGKGVVFLSEEQINDLLERLSFDEFNHYVEVVADCILAGKKYRKSHYKAILDMAEADRKVAHE